MGNNIKLDIVFFDPIPLFILFVYFSFFLVNKCLQLMRIFNIVPAPVIGKLETGKMPIAVIKTSAKSWVAISADTKRGQNSNIGTDVQRNTQKAEPHLIEHAVRPDIIARGI